MPTDLKTFCSTFHHIQFPQQGSRSAENCLYEGAYVAHLRRLFAAGVPKKNVQIYVSEDFFRNTEKTMGDAFKFLGLEPRLVDTVLVDTAQYRQVCNGRSHDSPLPSNLKLSDSLRRRMFTSRTLQQRIGDYVEHDFAYSSPVGISRHQRNASLIPSDLYLLGSRMGKRTKLAKDVSPDVEIF